MQHKLITTRYRVKTVQELMYIKANSTTGYNTLFRSGLFAAAIFPGVIDCIVNRQFLVAEGCLR